MSFLFRVRPMTTLHPQRRAAASWSFTGTHWLTSDGLAGSYADAATSAAARVVFPGAGVPVCTIAFWIKDMLAPGLCVGDAADNQPLIRCDAAGEMDWSVADALGTSYFPVSLTDPAGATWTHHALVCDGSTATAYGNGVADFSAVSIPGTYAAANSLTLLADLSHASVGVASIRSPAIWSRALTAGQVSALYSGGVGYDVRNVAGGGPVHWWPADGDSGTTITDRGSAGTCNLTLHGGVTIGS